MSNSESRKKATISRRQQIAGKGLCFAKEQGPARFIADVMLGRLAKWLRISGFDVLYSNHFSDDELVRISNSEERILLSRDTRLLVRKAVRRFIFLESQDLPSQIQQVFATLNPDKLPPLLTRCLTCNDALQDVSPESVRDIVPPFVFETQRAFKSCPRCGKVFWAGTHRDSVVQNLEKLTRK